MAEASPETATAGASAEDPGEITPQKIKLPCYPVDVCCHPQKDIVAACDMDGDVTIHSYSVTEKNHELFRLTHHKKAGRTVRFSPSGKRLFTSSKDKSIQMVNLDRGAVEVKLKKAHEASPYSMLVVDDNILVSGDDDGTLKVWDMRIKKTVMEMKENEDYISDMRLERSNRVLVATSGDGTLSAFDIRKHKMRMQSELFESDLMSCAILKREKKVVCGSGDGSLNIFNWGEWGNMSDRMAGHPDSVDCLVPLSDDVLLTGSADGIIRAIHIAPNRFMGVVGEHAGFPVENMSLSHCGKYLTTCTHDEQIYFWNVSDVLNEKVDASTKVRKAVKHKVINKQVQKDDFFAGMEEEKEDKEEGDSDDEDMEEGEDSDDDDSDDDDDNDDDEEEKKEEKESEKAEET